MSADQSQKQEGEGSNSASPRSNESALDEAETNGKFAPITGRDEEEISRIATSLSTPLRKVSRQDTLDGLAEDDPAVIPTSGKFDPYKWARLRIKQLDEEAILHERAGFVFKELNVSGTGAALQLQDTVGSVLLAPFRLGSLINLARSGHRRQILRNFDGVLRSGEMVMVLGRPGSGCSTFLKCICGELHGLDVHQQSTIHYNGIPMERMHKEFKGECVYNQEVDKHFPHLTVGQTLEFAAAARTPSQRLSGVSRKEFVKEMTQVAMAVLGLSHTYYSKG